MWIKGENKILTDVSVSDLVRNTILIPNTVKEISSFAFDQVSDRLKTIVFPENVEKLNDGVFENYPNLCGCIFKNPDCILDQEIFVDCKALTRVALPKHLRQIPNACFENCVNLTEIDIPDTVETLTLYSFYGCRNLREIRWKGHVYTYEDLVEYRRF